MEKQPVKENFAKKKKKPLNAHERNNFVKKKITFISPSWENFRTPA
jgi:hypothetical protein